MRSDQAMLKLMIDNNQLLCSVLSMLIADSSADDTLKKMAVDIIEQSGETIIDIKEVG